jgi:hypothetical protein
VDRYWLAWLEPRLDKTGEVADALRAAVAVDPAEASQPLDAYVNMVYRSLKNARRGLELASLLDAQESLPWFLEFVFTVHGRPRPFNKWLAWELETHPLPMQVRLDQLDRIARTGSVGDQQSLFRDVEKLARASNHAKTIEGWAADLAFLRG